MRLNKEETYSKGTKLTIAAVLMVILGYPGETLVDPNQLDERMIYWLMAMIPFLYILYNLVIALKNAISKQYKALLSFEGVEFEITEDGREQIAQLAVDKKIGARGLRSIMEKILLECMYDIPDKDTVDKVVLNKDAVLANKPIIVYKEKLKIKKKVGEN